MSDGEHIFWISLIVVSIIVCWLILPELGFYS